MYLHEAILDRIQKQLPRSNEIVDDPLQCDRWIASSFLQKSIRRCEVKLAYRAAARLHELDRVGLWRRLIGIAFEDVGAGDIETLVDTVAAATSAEWRRNLGDACVLDFIVCRLSEAPKDRSADYLMWAASEHESLGHACDLFGRAPISERLRIVADTSLPLTTRAVAAWFSSGIDYPYQRRVGPGDLQRLADVYRALGVADELAAATVIAARRTREPYTILVPLTWLEVQRGGRANVRNEALPRSVIVAGVPLYAFDEHTRLGKRAINRLVQENASIRACLERFVPKRRWTAAAQHAAFYAEGSLVSRRLDWAQSNSLEALGIESELSTAEVRRRGLGRCWK
jgi:hypothetical protein